MLPFSREAFFALFHSYNAAIYPVPLVMLLAALIAVLCLFKTKNIGGRAIAAILSLFWLWTGGVFHAVYFTPLNFLAPVYVVFFLLQACALLVVGVFLGRLDFHFDRSPIAWIGMVLAMLALLGYPLVEKLTGAPVSDLRFVGTAPGPTALFTVGLLLTVKKRMPALALVLIPLAALGVEIFTGYVLKLPFDIYIPAAACLAALLILAKKHAT